LAVFFAGMEIQPWNWAKLLDLLKHCRFRYWSLLFEHGLAYRTTRAMMLIKRKPYEQLRV
jgi:hypothetical protein